MSNFIADGTTLPDAKVDKTALPTTQDPKRFFSASDSNAFRQALIDTQSFLRGGFQLFDSTATNHVDVLLGSGVPTASANKGSLYIDRTNAFLYINTDGATTWAQVGVTSGAGWDVILNDALTSYSAIPVAFTQRTGSWTASVAGFQVDNGVNESYLSWESFPSSLFAGNWAMEADLVWTASGQSGNCDAGFVIDGGAGIVGAGFIRVFMHNAAGGGGTYVGWDKYGAGGSTFVTTFSTSSFRRFRVVVMADRGKLLLYLDNTLLTQVALSVGTPNRIGLWSNPGHTIFKNCRIWQTSFPAVP